MNFDSTYCISRILKKKQFDFGKIKFNISGQYDTKDVGVSTSDVTNRGFEIHTQIFENRYGISYIRSEFYNFDSSRYIEFDKDYRILSTIAFDWDYKILLFVLLKMTKIQFVNTVNEIEKLEGGDIICHNLQRLLDYYNNSKLNVADSES